MTGISFFVFLLGTLFGSGAFFRKGGEMLATYVLFPIVAATALVGLTTHDTEAFFGQINRSALYGTLLGVMGLAGYHIAVIRQRGGLSMAGLGPDIRLGFKTLWASLRNLPLSAAQAGTRARNARSVYYETAVKLAVLTTLIDKTRGADGFASVKATFNLDRTTCPQALNIFNAQMRSPQRLSAVLKPFLNQYGRASTIAETLIYGMCKVALADGSVSKAEIRLIDRAADILGLHTFDTWRVMASAGIEIENEFAGHGSGGTRWQDDRWTRARQKSRHSQSWSNTAPKSERSRPVSYTHLTLPTKA